MFDALINFLTLNLRIYIAVKKVHTKEQSYLRNISSFSMRHVSLFTHMQSIYQQLCQILFFNFNQLYNDGFHFCLSNKIYYSIRAYPCEPSFTIKSAWCPCTFFSARVEKLYNNITKDYFKNTNHHDSISLSQLRGTFT